MKDEADRDARTSREISPYLLLREQEIGSARADNKAWIGQRVDLRDHWRVVRKYRWVIASVFLVLVVSTAIVTFTMDPRYTATAKIQIERRAPNIAPVEGVEKRDDYSYDQKYDYYQTQFKVLQSRTIAARVIRALGLDRDPRFVDEMESGFVEGVIERIAGVFDSLVTSPTEGEGTEAPTELGIDPDLIESYLDMLGVVPIVNSRLVDVSFTSKDAGLSTEAANRHVEEYVNALLEGSVETTLRAKGFLEEEIAKTRDRLVAAEAALNAYRKVHRILAVDGEKSDIVSDRLADLSARYTEAQAERFRLEGQYALIQKRDYESLPDVLASKLVSDLKVAASATEAKRAELARKFKPSYPAMGQVIAQEAETRKRLDTEIRKIVAGIESGYLAAKNREESLRRELDAQRDAALSQKDVAAEYGTLLRDVETARELYKSLLQRLKDVDVAGEIKVSNVSVVDRAAPPKEPSHPKKELYLALAATFGILMGIGLAFLLDYLDNSLSTLEEVNERLGLPALGVVPSFDSPALAYAAYGYGSSDAPAAQFKRSDAENRHGSKLPSEIVMSSHPRSLISEAYRTIRTKILLSSPADRPNQVILFTSGLAGEGKTVTAVNQAITLVQTGARVLLIDADIRKPRIHQIFSTSKVQGLSTYLAGQSTLEAVIHEIDLNGTPRAVGNGNGVLQGQLAVIPSGPLPPNPAELLGSRRMRDTIELLRERYDFILIDTPPVQHVADALLLSTMSDGVVLVVRGQETPVDVVLRARDNLEEARARIVGVVLNDVDPAKGDYYDYKQYYRADEWNEDRL